MKPIDIYNNYSKIRDKNRCPFCGYKILGSYSDTYYCKAFYTEDAIRDAIYRCDDDIFDCQEPCTINDMMNCGVPDVDLDNLVTYAVPKVICTDGYSLHLIYNVSHCEAHIQPHYAELKFYSASDKDLAHALFWVLDQVRQDEEVKDNGK